MPVWYQNGTVLIPTQTAQEAWDHVETIFHDNKRTRTVALKGELWMLQVGDLSIDAYFHKIKSISIILSSLGSPISNDDIVTFSFERLSDKYDHIAGIITHREPFPDLNTVRSMITMEEMRLKSKSQALHTDSSSSSPMILLAE
ncbi:hybrid signal transduction histidine kinase M [Tanacetum coccineum]